MPPEIPIAESVLAILATIAVIGAAVAWMTHVYLPANVREWHRLTMELSKRLATLENDRQRDYTEMQRLRIRLTELEIGVRVLIAQVKRLGESPDWGDDAAPPGDAAPVDNMVLDRNIAALFDVDEIDDLAFRLGIPPDEIEGKRRETRARNLVLYADRRERVDELVELVRQLRPEWRMQ